MLPPYSLLYMSSAGAALSAVAGLVMAAYLICIFILPSGKMIIRFVYRTCEYRKNKKETIMTQESDSNKRTAAHVANYIIFLAEKKQD